jgi:peptide/nickel transport system substrate-binding protein
MAADTSLRFEQALVLRSRWTAQEGVILLNPTQERQTFIQQRPEFVNPRDLLDLRVRRALLHAIDRKTLADTILSGEGQVAESVVPPTVGYFRLLDGVVPKYPYDVRRVDELMREAGFVKDSDGFYASQSEGRFNPGVRGLAEGDEARESTIVTDYFRQAGIEATLDLVPAAFYRTDMLEKQATFPALRPTYSTLSSTFSTNKFITAQIASADTRWNGVNKTGWSNPEFDQLYDAFNKELEVNQRDRLMIDLARLLNEFLPVLPLYFNFEVAAHSAALRGPEVSAPSSTTFGNIHLWEWR